MTYKLTLIKKLIIMYFVLEIYWLKFDYKKINKNYNYNKWKKEIEMLNSKIMEMRNHFKRFVFHFLLPHP